MAIGRFQVMAMLQAARAYRLGLPLESSLSWGLNRAIFYAAAKRGFRRLKMPRRPRGEALAKPLLEERAVFYLGDEMAYKTEVEPELLDETVRRECYPAGDYHTLYFGLILGVYAEEDARERLP